MKDLNIFDEGLNIYQYHESSYQEEAKSFEIKQFAYYSMPYPLNAFENLFYFTVAAALKSCDYLTFQALNIGC